MLSNQEKHPCSMCKTKNHCCVDQEEDEGMVLVDFRDVKRLVDFTGKSPDKFAHFKKLSDDKLEDLTNDEKYYFIDGHVLLLKKPKLRCTFLDKDNRCTVHVARPNLCRLYPFWYEEDEDGNLKVIRHNERKDDVCHITKKSPRISDKLFKWVGTSKESLLKVSKDSNDGLEEYQKYKKYLLVESISDVMKRIDKDKINKQSKKP